MYTVSEERATFKVERLDAYLSEWIWRRTVDCRGQISLANHNYKVGEAYHGQSVRVHFDTVDRHLVCVTASGQQLGRIQVPELEVEYILGLEHH
jgi:hypothetical protein